MYPYFLGISLFVLSSFSHANDEAKWNVKFDSYRHIRIDEPENISLIIGNLKKTELIKSKAVISVISSDPSIVKVSKIISTDEIDGSTWNGHFVAEPIGLGKSTISVEINHLERIEVSLKKMDVHVHRHRIFFKSEIFTNSIRILYIIVSFIIGSSVNFNGIKAIPQNLKALGLATFLHFVFISLVGLKTIFLFLSLDSIFLHFKTKPFIVDYLRKSHGNEYNRTDFFLFLMFMGSLNASNCWAALLGGNFDLSVFISIFMYFITHGKRKYKLI